MSESAIEAKMNKLVDKMSDGREDQLSEVVSMRKTLKSAMLKKDLRNHAAMQKLLELLRKREASFTMVLANKEDLDPVKREGFFQRRKELRFILSFFDSVDRTIDGIERQLDYQLSEELSTPSGDDE